MNVGMSLLIKPGTPPAEVSRAFTPVILAFDRRLEDSGRRFIQWVKIGAEKTPDGELDIIFVAKVEEQ